MFEPNKRKLPGEFPCFLCGDFQQLLLDKKNHPYFICNPCGVQCFIRKNEGIKKIEDIFEDPKLRKIVLSGKTLNNSELLRIKERIKLINTSLNKTLIPFSEIDLETRNILKSKLEALEANYLNILKNS